jgi:hypothetical protein
MIAFTVSVDYTDVLRLTLPRQRKHFDRHVIVTSSADAKNVQPVAETNDAEVFVTDLFYAKGADFNKYAALEAAMDAYGRTGFITLLDADIVYPERAKLIPELGKIVGPNRYLYPEVTNIPPESEWPLYRLHRNTAEWAGYSVTFHAQDPVLGPPPWHETDWRHAGGADSFFQRKWDRINKVRTTWNCLHLGPCGANWCGRVSSFADGTSPSQADERSGKLKQYFAGRNTNRSFSHEKINRET